VEIDLSDASAIEVFEHLENQLRELDFITIQGSEIPTRDAAWAQGEFSTELRQLRYSIVRRLDIWRDVYQLAHSERHRIGSLPDHEISNFILASANKLNANAVDQGWAEYLELPAAVSAFNSLQPNEFEQRKTARKFMARLHSPALSGQQSEYLRTTIPADMVEALRTRATSAVDLAKLVQRVENLELMENGATSFYVNNQYQNLLWSREPDFVQLAETLDAHYRNANFRVSISEQILNRMVPVLPDSSEPFRDQIFGAHVVGRNQISNRVEIRTIPDPDHISLRLETVGRVRSNTTAHRSGFTVQNEGISRFRVIKRLAFGRNGIFSDHPVTMSESKQRMVGMRSDLDAIPVLGWMARRIAHQKIQQQSPLTEQYARRKLENTAESRFEHEVNQQLDQLTDYLQTNLLDPLISLDLEPQPIETSTTEDRIVLRYRLAGRDQLAAHTARPMAIKSSMMSIQMHESVINNLLNRIEIAGQKFTATELADHLKDVVGTDVISNVCQAEADAEFEFAPFDPVRINFQNNRIQVTINLKSFRVANGKRWKNLQVRTEYIPYVDGLRLTVKQSDDGISLKGRNLNCRDQIAIRTIFTSIFQDQAEFAIVPAPLAQKLGIGDLAIHQFTASNGWIGISVDQSLNRLNSATEVRAHEVRMFAGRPFRK
jgi:hypothetical protein